MMIEVSIPPEVERALISLALLRRKERKVGLKILEAHISISLADSGQNQVLSLIKEGKANQKHLDLSKAISEQRNWAFNQLLHKRRFLSLLIKLQKIQMYRVRKYGA